MSDSPASQVVSSISGATQVVEHEVLRIVATVRGTDSKDAFKRARNEALLWVKNRTQDALPGVAWTGHGFDHLRGGRSVLARSVDTEMGNLWALRADDPDKNIPGRIWTTEVTIGSPNKGLSQMSLRLMASSSEMDLEISPHVPGVIRKIASRCGLLCSGGFSISDIPKYIGSKDLDELIALLESPNRRLPVIVASGDERSQDTTKPLIDTRLLAQATLGLAHVVVLPAVCSYALSDAFGKVRSVFHGAVRIYKYGFNRSADPYEHPLFVGHSIRHGECELEIRRLAAIESVRRTRLGHDVLPFADVQSEAARREAARREDARRESLTERVIQGDRLTAMRQHIEALKREVDARQVEVKALKNQVMSAKSEGDRNFDLAAQEEERAKIAEADQHGLRAHVGALREMLSQQEIDPDRDLELPYSWGEFAEWCEKHFAGRLVLTSQARRGIKRAMFCDPECAGECVLWLSSTYRDVRMKGHNSTQDSHDVSRFVIGQKGTVLRGVVNSSCGGDAFSFDWQGRRLKADLHIKNGGNTRDPGRCLRIYYCYDDITQQIVVADMPSHRRTGAT